MNKDIKLTGWENFWYYLSVIMTGGAVFTIKVVIKKAMETK